jgi:hypothetical protein
MDRTVRLFFVLPFLFLAGCEDSAPHPENWAVTTSISRTAFKAGDTVTVTVTVTNIGPDAGAINSKGCPLPFEVMPAGTLTVVGPQDVVCTTEQRFATLAPGESFSYHTVWDGKGRTANRAFGDPVVLLSQGDYMVQGIAPTDAGLVASGNSLGFVILPPS